MKPTDKHPKVVTVSHIPPSRYKRLRIRELATKPFLGDLSVLHLHLPARARLPNIYHRRTAELIYCLKGSMMGLLNGRKYRLKTGSVIYIPRRVWHEFITGPIPCEALAVFHPALSVGRHADIHAEPGVRLWD